MDRAWRVERVQEGGERCVFVRGSLVGRDEGFGGICVNWELTISVRPLMSLKW